MCWGAVTWARVRKMFVGINRSVAAEFGWSDEFFYTELGRPARERQIKTSEIENDETKVLVHNLFQSSPTSRRRISLGGQYLQKVYKEIFKPEESNPGEETNENDSKDNDQFMKEAVKLAKLGQSGGLSKEREPFGTVIVKDGSIVGRGFNRVLLDYDPTATSEIVAITDASKTLGSHNLEGCIMYSTGEPDVMSMGAIYWANIKAVNIGYSLSESAAAGFEDGLIHYAELNNAEHKSLEVYNNIAFDVCRNVFVKYDEFKGTMY